MKVLAVLVILVGLYMIGALLAESPAVTGGPNPFAAPEDQAALFAFTVVVGLMLGFAVDALRDHGDKGG